MVADANVAVVGLTRGGVMKYFLVRLQHWPELSKALATFAGYFLLAAIVLGANPFRGETVGPFDLLTALPGWSNGVEPHAIRNSERSDVLDALLPRWMFARTMLREGHLPIWNPLPGGGEAGLQNLANAELNPAFVIFTVAPTAATGLYFATLFNLAM